MTRGGKTATALVCLTIAGLLLCMVHSAQADDCREARGIYERAVRLMNYQERRDAFQRAVDLCPSYVEAHVNLADVFENLGEFEQAEQHYHKALELRPAYHLPYIGLGEVYLKTGRFTLAKKTYERGLAIASDNERLSDGLKVVEERLRRERSLFTAEHIATCLTEDENFRLMCMCPESHYDHLKRWICIPPVLFSTDSSVLSPEAQRQLDEIGKALKSGTLADETWSVIGHADNIGDPEYNLSLSKQRAAAVKQYLVKRHGLRPECLNLKFLGQVFPRASNNNAGGRSENRRVEIVRDHVQP